eukprot:COSAG01_NODE_196_length_22350_cov_812.929136_14_plen_113_part_00
MGADPGLDLLGHYEENITAEPSANETCQPQVESMDFEVDSKEIGAIETIEPSKIAYSDVEHDWGEAPTPSGNTQVHIVHPDPVAHRWARCCRRLRSAACLGFEDYSRDSNRG